MMQIPSIAVKLGLAILIVAAASCNGKFRRVQKNEDWRIKYEASIEYYEKKDYYRAALLFEDIRPNVRGLPEGEKVEFYLAYCQYYEKTYLLASDQFRSFYETYGRSAFAEEAEFMHAYALYVSSPPPNLDQQSGIEAMEAMQNFLNKYPTSSFYDRAIEVINTSQQKLEVKGFENAKQYYKIKYYKAAVIALQNFAKEFPDSKLAEDAAVLKITAQYKLAEQSLLNLQMARYQAVVDFYLEMIDAFPNSKYTRDVEKYYSDSLSKLNKLKIDKNT
jgi:outer membrane protein assembly factor BamD